MKMMDSNVLNLQHFWLSEKFFKSDVPYVALIPSKTFHCLELSFHKKTTSAAFKFCFKELYLIGSRTCFLRGA